MSLEVPLIQKLSAGQKADDRDERGGDDTPADEREIVKHFVSPEVC